MLDRERVREVYLEAAERPADQRPAFLDLRCAGDAELRAEVESLLASADRRPAFLGSPTTTPPEAPEEVAGTRIGPYRLLQEIGRGGFGSVYMADQDEPVRRRVALKVIKLGMDTRAVIARFEAERQALAMMDHANIARVFDAGATETGRPYFVMELVRGDPITVYCDKNNLSIPERLHLFVQVCHAVQHAHGKGVVHRDIKPGNVLVATEDGRPHAKVIDFGIAKATERPLTDKTVFTDFRQFIGTPEYMSPEQAEGSLNIDTRSDVYSLGVLLYELLTGDTPFDPKALRSAAYAEIQRIIREVEPPKPSTRLSLSATLGQVASQRRTDPERLSALVKGDLDWIVMRALDKDRARRYDTASALAADVGRHLSGEPVEAAPPSAAYRIRKFVRRHRVPAIGAAAVAIALILGVIGTSIGLVQANAARENEKSHRLAAQDSAARAEAEAARATRAETDAKVRSVELERVAEFQQVQLAGVDAHAMGLRLRADLLSQARRAAERTGLAAGQVDARIGELDGLVAGSDFTGMALQVLEESVLEPALAAIAAQFGDQPLVKARLLQTAADTMRELGLHEAARAPQDESLAIRRRELGNDHNDTITSINNAGCLAMRSGRSDESETLLREAVAARKRTAGETDPLTLTCMTNLGALLERRGKLDEAYALDLAILEERRRVLGNEHPDTLRSVNNLGTVVLAQRRYADAVALFREVVDDRKRLIGIESDETLTSMGNLARALQAQGELSEAASIFREVLEHRRRLLGDDHPHTLTAIGNIGLVLQMMNKRSEAAPYLRESLERKRRILGDRRIDTLTAMSNLAFLLYEDGNLPEAEGLFREAIAGFRVVAGEEYQNTLFAMIGLASVLNKTDRFADTITILAPAEASARRVFVSNNSFRLGQYLALLGRARMATNDFDAAEANLTESLSIYHSAHHTAESKALQNLVDLFEARHHREPDRGYDKRRDEWRAKLEDATIEPKER